MFLIWKSGEYLFDRLSDETVNRLHSMITEKKPDVYRMPDRFAVEQLTLVYELSSRERIALLNECAKKYNTVVNTYEPEKCTGLVGVKVLPPIEQQGDELYRIYAASRINLNVTMRSIETGVPQRVFDIMSVGGLVFSNYQEEAEELFEDGKEIVLFSSLDEFTDKADYYIHHEEEALKVGARGYLKVRDKYNYTESVKNIVKTVFPGFK